MAEKKKKKSAIDKLNSGEVEMVKPVEVPQDLKNKTEVKDPTQPSIEGYISILQQMRTKKKHLTSAPTFTPKNFYDSIQFYDTGGVRRLYLFVNNDWRYVVLT